MAVTLDQLLTLAGHLDDAPGYDTPRERFRRFLHEYVRDPQLARALIVQGQYAPGEQHRRAVIDLVVHAGKFIGFDATFGGALPAGGAMRYHGLWQSRSRVAIVISALAEGATAADLEGLRRTVAALRSTSLAKHGRTMGLAVLMSTHTRDRLDQFTDAPTEETPVATVTLRGLLSLADMVASGGVQHDDVVKLVEQRTSMDFITGMLERMSVGTAGAATMGTPAPAVMPVVTGRSGATDTTSAPSAPAETGYWMATVAAEFGTSPEDLLNHVVLRRNIFGVTANAATSGLAKVGDWICFAIARKGVVGHARIASLADGSSEIRDAHRFRQLFHLERMRLYLEAPVAIDAATEVRLKAGPFASPRAVQALIPISPESFRALTSESAVTPESSS